MSRRNAILGLLAIIVVGLWVLGRTTPTPARPEPSQEDRQTARQIIAEALEKSRKVPLTVSISVAPSTSACRLSASLTNDSRVLINLLDGQLVLANGQGTNRAVKFAVQAMRPGETRSVDLTVPTRCGREAFIDHADVLACSAQTVGQPPDCFFTSNKWIAADGSSRPFGIRREPDPTPAKSSPRR